MNTLNKQTTNEDIIEEHFSVEQGQYCRRPLIHTLPQSPLGAHQAFCENGLGLKNSHSTRESYYLLTKQV